MITISAFADEIDPSLKTQMDVCESNGVRCIDVRNIDGKNCSKLTVDEAAAYGRQMADRGFAMPCLGTPIGKIRMDEDVAPHLELLKHCGDVARAFGTKRLRVFSFYASQGKQVEHERAAVFERMAAMLAVAERHDLILMHENESRIYGSTPAGVLDLFAAFRGPRFQGIFDPANFVTDGFYPYLHGWTKGLDCLTDYFHVKDKQSPGAAACVPAGHGAGQFPEIFADLKKRNWSGYMTLEPHLKTAGQFAGFSGPDRFGAAVKALHEQLDRAGLEYRR